MKDTPEVSLQKAVAEAEAHAKHVLELQRKLDNRIFFLVHESGSGSGVSMSLFDNKEKAKEYFRETVEAYDDFTDLTEEEQQEVLDKEELRCHDDNVIRIFPLSLN